MSETTAEPRHDAEWNADELACGELVLELMLHIKTIEPGRVLKVTTDDPGAPQDIPAWCNLTDNVLLAQRPPHYWIRRQA
jgi:tRNA 2-thiouridine synthesizing protein A